MSNGDFNLDDIFKQLNGQMESMDPDELAKMQQNGPMMFGNIGNNNNKSNKQKTLLDEYGINITKLARQNKLDPVIGRDAEINRLVEILNRRTKNNPVLIGEPGVGKTAVVEGLAQAIVNGNVPNKLLNKEVIRLDMISMVQGTSMRGQFEARMQKLIKEVSQASNIILFIDEIHEIMGAGASGSNDGMDAGNILKPALARGEFQLIGATTLNEYRKIEKDGAIARRFQPVQVNEPSKEETFEILKGIRNKYEEYHQVKYSDDILRNAIVLSVRYINDRFLPDKAIDLLDEAGSKKNLKLQTFNADEIQKKIDIALKSKQEAVDSEDYQKALQLQNQISLLNSQKELADKNPAKDNPNIAIQDLLNIIEEKTKIPVSDLNDNQMTKLKNLQNNISNHVIGQTKAAEKIARSIRRSRVGLTKTGRPIGSFLFIGPTGVGKTQTAKELAKELFGSEEAIIRLDMSEYMEAHSISKIVGSPAGYVGYEDAGRFTEKVRRHPYSLILIDEIEKAHKDVLNIFLQILDDGRLTDAQGKTVSFKDTVIIATSNAGSSDTLASSVGFSVDDIFDEKQKIINKLKAYFKPEFLNRFDDIIEFKTLDKDDLGKIVDLMIAEINNMIGEKNIHLEINNETRNWLIENGYQPELGARPLRRLLQESIEDKIADLYLEDPSITNMKSQIINNQVVINKA
ncbi:MAG: ATP-dependent Clp protease ATP-binding subunit [Lactobacillaceae bacterium]|jgi:ATP-dependent Clp protease ATP-binding subunit ClpE|nr:ATP-dependent Clp protease ATP-binding subunit [Lactobacillaceae bacterium]